jgi:phosphatidylglycerol:prolipoprotein diacylglycerol transferase
MGDAARGPERIMNRPHELGARAALRPSVKAAYICEYPAERRGRPQPPARRRRPVAGAHNPWSWPGRAGVCHPVGAARSSHGANARAPRILDRLLRLPIGRRMGPLAIPFPAIDPVALRLGPLMIKWYGLAYMAGLLLGWLYIKQLLRSDRLWPGAKAPFAPEKADDLLLFMTLGVLLGGRLGYVLFYEPRFFLSHPLEIPAVWNGGMSFHGALIGSIIAIVVFARRRGIAVWSVMDLTAAATPMGLFFGRLANFINGELWGRPSTLPWAMVFPNGGSSPRHPSQLYEAALEGALLFCVLLYLSHRRGALRHPGLIAGTFLIGYGLARSFSELFREPDPSHVLTQPPFTAGILYSLPMVVAGALIVRAALKRAAGGADVRG